MIGTLRGWLAGNSTPRENGDKQEERSEDIDLRVRIVASSSHDFLGVVPDCRPRTETVTVLEV